MKIAVTGTVGSGKSRVVSILAGFFQAAPVDADDICREMMQPGNAGWEKMLELWGDRFVAADGHLDRVRLRESVFASSEIRKGLEDILHPLVRQRILDSFAQAEEDGTRLVAEIPLLYEVGWADEFDKVVAVYAPSHVCIERTAVRDGVEGEQVAAIMDLQLSPEEKAERADYVIDNSGIWSSTVLQAAVVARKLHDAGL